jgi:pimeloyl-ACP methyl ester carboxylesterase
MYLIGMTDLTLPQGTLNVRDTGSGRPIVFVHGLLVDGTLWRKVVPLLSTEYRCIWPDWPLGSHTRPMAADADLSPRGVANLIADALDALELEDVTLVGNDTGGALCQLLVTDRPERIGRLVLTNCDAFENFPPKMFKPLVWMARVPGLLNAGMQPMRVRSLRRLPIAYGMLTSQPVPDDVTDAWVRPFLTQSAIRRDTVKLLRAVDPDELAAAAEKLRGFDRPALLAWGSADRAFKLEWAYRLAELLPQGRVEEIPGARTFVSEDAPERLAQLIAGQMTDSTTPTAA